MSHFGNEGVGWVSPAFVSGSTRVVDGDSVAPDRSPPVIKGG